MNQNQKTEEIPEPVSFGGQAIQPEKTQTINGWNVALHYEKLGLDERWNDSDRIDRLCNMLKITIYEMADIIRVSHAQMSRWHKNKRFPPTICLWFSLIEYCFFNDKIPDPIESDLFPWKKMYEQD